jgi:hypothetical protein
LSNNYDSIKYDRRRNLVRERAIERPLEGFSKQLWPWSESKLIFLVGLLAVLDYISTYVFLTFGSYPQVIEGGLLAGWALQSGGFLKLFLVDVVCVGTLMVLAISIQSLYSRLGIRGLGRAAFVFLLIPYFIVSMAVIYNNIFWALI